MRVPSAGFRDESEACLSALADAALNIQAATRRLNAAPNADGLTKNAIEIQVAEIRCLLDSLTQRLDDVPAVVEAQKGARPARSTEEPT